MTQPDLYQQIQVGERLARLEERMTHVAASAVALASDATSRLNKIDNNLDQQNTERDKRFDQVDVRLKGIETLISEGKGIGRVAAVIWPVVASVITAILYQFIGPRL